MYGFYIYSGSQKSKDITRLFDAHQLIEFGDFIFGYKSFSKFWDDKLFFENEQYVIGLDGVMLNKKSLINQYAADSFKSLIIKLFEQERTNFPNYLRGVFSGFVFEKENQKLFFFNDQVATKQVFYSKQDSELIIAPNLKFITDIRRALGLKNTLDIQAAYTMLSFGGMLENQTLVKYINKLGAGEYLSFSGQSVDVKRYHDFNDIGDLITDKNKAIKLLDETFQTALHLEYVKDKEYNYRHIATLSGGLDSRMNVMLANKIGYKPDTFCFSQSGYADDKIATKIASHLKLSHTFIPLDGGDYLKNLTEMVNINSGLQFYHGSAHYHYALNQMDLKEHGLIHTGQLGGGILGDFILKNNIENPQLSIKDIEANVRYKKIFKKLNIDLNEFKHYKNGEILKFYQRNFNIVNYGSFVVEQHRTYLLSPFYDVDFIKIALSIMPRLKYKHDIYIDWINTKHPEVARYRWEKTGFKPNAKWKSRLSRYTNKIKKEYHQLLGSTDKLSMNPIDFWLKTNPSIKTFYQEYYAQNKNKVHANEEIFKDFEEVMQQGKFMEKAIVLTILELVRSLSLEVPDQF